MPMLWRDHQLKRAVEVIAAYLPYVSHKEIPKIGATGVSLFSSQLPVGRIDICGLGLVNEEK